MTVIRVLVVDDHPIVRAGLRTALDADPEVSVVGESGSGEQALVDAERTHPDVVLMDLHLAGGIDGPEATRRILALDSPPRVLVLTTYDSDIDILQAIEAGSTGYLLKDTEPTALLEAIHATAAGETALAPSVASRLVSRTRTPMRRLTPREGQILGMVADGRTNKEIARALFITEATVKSHLVQVYAKLEVESRTAAVAEARRRGIVRY